MDYNRAEVTTAMPSDSEHRTSAHETVWKPLARAMQSFKIGCLYSKKGTVAL